MEARLLITVSSPHNALEHSPGCLVQFINHFPTQLFEISAFSRDYQLSIKLFLYFSGTSKMGKYADELLTKNVLLKTVRVSEDANPSKLPTNGEDGAVDEWVVQNAKQLPITVSYVAKTLADATGTLKILLSHAKPTYFTLSLH